MEMAPMNKFLPPRFFRFLFGFGIVLSMTGWSGAALGAATDQATQSQATQIQALTGDIALCENNPADPRWKKLQSLIAPHNLGDTFDGDWRFACIEHFDETDMVFSLANKRAGKKLYVWLTDIHSPITTLGTSKNFKVLCLAENGKPIDKAHQEIAGKIVVLIQKNDSGKLQWRLKEVPKSAKKHIVRVPSKPGRDPARGSNALIFRVVFFSILFILALGIFYRIAAKIRASRRNASKT